MKVHQFVPSLSRRDAIGNHSLALAEVLQEMGVSCDFYVDGPGLDKVGIAHLYTEFPSRQRPGDLVIYQLGTYAQLVNMLLATRQSPVVNYHNITPANFFEPWDPDEADHQREARRQFGDLAQSCRLGLADSAFNGYEMEDFGYSNIEVLPVIFSTERTSDEASELPLGLNPAHDPIKDGADWLFVGRLIPHKAPHQLLGYFATYRKVYDPKARLHLVGASFSATYTRALKVIAKELSITEHVYFHGAVSDSTLALFYKVADVYVSSSLHEGFCVPILEAFSHALPVVAVAAGAVPETIADGGLMVSAGDALGFASAANILLDDPKLREDIVLRGQSRLHELAPSKTRLRFRQIMEGLLS